MFTVRTLGKLSENDYKTSNPERKREGEEYEREREKWREKES